MSFLKALRSNRAQDRCAPLLVPERSLLVAIIQRAVNDYCGSHEKLAREAAEWMFTDTGEYGNEAFTCQWICEHVDIDHQQFTSAVKALALRGE